MRELIQLLDDYGILIFFLLSGTVIGAAASCDGYLDMRRMEICVQSGGEYKDDNCLKKEDKCPNTDSRSPQNQK